MQPNQNPNMQPNPAVPQGAEAQPNLEAPQASVAPEKALQPSGAAAPAPGVPMTPPPLAPPASTQPINNPGQQLPVQKIAPVGTSPAVAEDVDVIEKEWVDQADRVIESTKNEPYQEEESVEALQMDYLKKRYGHDVKKPEENA